jgi:hypothetical protein
VISHFKSVFLPRVCVGGILVFDFLKLIKN